MNTTKESELTAATPVDAQKAPRARIVRTTEFPRVSTGLRAGPGGGNGSGSVIHVCGG